jgi:adenine-specific DNA-methyltransferase
LVGFSGNAAVASASKSFCALAKRAARTLSKNGLSAEDRLELCLQLIQKKTRDTAINTLADILASLPINEQHYWVGTFYTLLLPADLRKRQSAYFTSPEIARQLLRQVERQGVDFSCARVLDPAAGGAAFLSMVAARMRELGCRSTEILKRIRGVELDPMLAELARQLIAKRLGLSSIPKEVVTVGDALQVEFQEQYDVVLANPPYGRIFPQEIDISQWTDVCHPGRVNKYALFVDLSLKQVKPGGTVGLVLPSSFIAGPLYSPLRKSIRTRSSVKVLGHIECREEFFLDVEQDTSLLILQKFHSGKPTWSIRNKPVSFARIDKAGCWNPCPPITLPSSLEDAWILPSPKGAAKGGATLADYHCKITSGYFVWNRETERMTKNWEDGKALPLFWACNIKPNASCRPDAKDGVGTDFVRFEEPSPAVIRSKSILIQRTTNSKQPRRLIAGIVDNPNIITSGYISENHTIVLRPEHGNVDLSLICRLLNSNAVDCRYRQLSGTASVSTLLLRKLDLPSPENLARACSAFSDFELAVEKAYDASMAHSWKTAS